MSTENDPYWDHLGIAWRDVHIDSDVLATRLHAELKRESWRQKQGLIIGMLAALCGIAVGVAWLHKSVVGAKGIGVSTIVGIVALLALYPWVRRQPISGDAGTLIGMIDVSIAQARRRQRDDKAGYAGSLILVLVGGLIAYICYSHLRFPFFDVMQMIIYVIVMAIVFVVFGYRDARASRERQARFEYLKRTLSTSEESQ
jgi:undecaprenyl pyrophosphate phosphatase UppP